MQIDNVFDCKLSLLVKLTIECVQMFMHTFVTVCNFHSAKYSVRCYMHKCLFYIQSMLMSFPEFRMFSCSIKPLSLSVIQNITAYCNIVAWEKKIFWEHAESEQLPSGCLALEFHLLTHERFFLFDNKWVDPVAVVSLNNWLSYRPFWLAVVYLYLCNDGGNNLIAYYTFHYPIFKILVRKKLL